MILLLFFCYLLYCKEGISEWVSKTIFRDHEGSSDPVSFPGLQGCAEHAVLLGLCCSLGHQVSVVANWSTSTCISPDLHKHNRAQIICTSKMLSQPEHSMQHALAAFSEFLLGEGNFVHCCNSSIASVWIVLESLGVNWHHLPFHSLYVQQGLRAQRPCVTTAKGWTYKAWTVIQSKTRWWSCLSACAPTLYPYSQQHLFETLFASACGIAPPVRKLVLKGLDSFLDPFVSRVGWFIFKPWHLY